MTTSETSTRTPLTRPDGSPLRALVVDDEPTLADLLSMALRYEGWDVHGRRDRHRRRPRGPRVRAPTSWCST